MDNRFDYHQPRSEDVKEAHGEVRDLLKSCAIELEAILPESRELSICITKLEEAMFWANAGIARNQ